MWKSIYVANNKEQAASMQSALEAEGIMTHVRPAGMETALDGIFEVQVLESEVEEAQGIVCRGGRPI